MKRGIIHTANCLYRHTAVSGSYRGCPSPNVVIPPKGGIQFCVPQNLRNNSDDSAPIGPRRGATCDGWVMPGEGNPQKGGGGKQILPTTPWSAPSAGGESFILQSGPTKQISVSRGRKGRKHQKHLNFVQKPAEIRRFLQFFHQNRAIFAIFSTFYQILLYFMPRTIFPIKSANILPPTNYFNNIKIYKKFINFLKKIS